MLVCPSCRNALVDDVERCIYCRTARPPLGWDVEERVGRVLLGRYTVERRIGAGATGAVYRATDERAASGAEPRVAVKFLHDGRRADADFVARFRREALAAARIDHPGVARCFAFGEEDGEVFLVMEYVAGWSLESRLNAGGPLPPGLSAAWGAEIADALAAAHTHGVIHRDLKPANIWLVPDPGRGRERIKVLDFGYALIRTSDQGAWRVTRTGLLVGSPAYMAPEQTIGSGAIDGRTDLYALGVVLYRMLVGRRPLAAKSIIEQLRLQRDGRPTPLREAAPAQAIPVELDRIVLRLLEKAPARRFQQAADLAAALRALALPVEPSSLAGPGGPPNLPGPGTARTPAGH